MHLRINLPVIFFLLACAKDKGLPDINSGYPVDVDRIIRPKCATRGCHSSADRDAAAGLSLQSWKELFEGGRNGPVVIPFRPDFSTLCFFTNTFSDLGPVQSPRMPYGANSLSREEYLALRNWIISGAPDVNGNINGYGGANSKKIYITNQFCDVVTVVDTKSRLPIKYITVGNLPQTEFPYDIKVSPNNRYWYVSFFVPNGLIQRFDAITDEPAGNLNLGRGLWSTLCISPDSRFAFFADNSEPGRIACADLEQMKVLSMCTSSLSYPRGIVANPASKQLLVGTEYGNYIYVVDYSDPMNLKISQKVIDGGNTVKEEYSLAPHDFAFSPNGSRCFVSCEGSNEIKVLNANDYSLISFIPLPAGPARMQVSSTGLLFVTCPYDSLSFADNIGSVIVVNTNDNSVIKKINSGFQPNGIVIDNDEQIAGVANSNLSAKGPAPHHVSGCAGRNGYLTYIDMGTLSLVQGKRYELAVYPYAMAAKTK